LKKTSKRWRSSGTRVGKHWACSRLNPPSWRPAAAPVACQRAVS
jgi:hypothetical protein